VPYAVVVEVSIDPTSDVAHRHGILEEFVIPDVGALPGVVRAVWMNDGGRTGTCVMCARPRTQREARSRS
jgi:hypothetical protein